MPRCLASIRRHPDPIVCVYAFTGVLYSLIQPQVYREALVKKLNLSLEVKHNGTVSCLNVSTQIAKKEDEVQQVTSELLFNLSLISILPMCVTAAIGGGLIDLTRRKKVFMVISVLGQVISFVSLLVILHTSLGLYVQPVAYVTGSVIYSMGSSGLLTTAVYSYISETTKTRNKTWRMIITETMLIAGFALGVITGGPLADSRGLSAVALLGLSLTAFNIIYIVFILKRRSRVITEDVEKRRLLNESNGKNSLTCCGSLVYGFKAGFKLFRGDRCFDRMALYYSVLSYGLFMLLEISKMSLIVLILRYYPFCFSNLDISLYQGEQMLLQISAIGLVLVLVRRFGWRDDTLIIIGFASLTLSLLAVGLSFNMVTIYLGLLAGSLQSYVLGASRAMMSKAVQDDAQGVLFGFTGIVMAISDVCGNLIANAIYSSTVTLDLKLPNPASVLYFTVGGLSGITMFIALIIRCFKRVPAHSRED